jgi:hypothetical protein
MLPSQNWRTRWIKAFQHIFAMLNLVWAFTGGLYMHGAHEHSEHISICQGWGFGADVTRQTP